MCELLAVAWPEPRPFGDLEDRIAEMERFGVAGFGWGVAWRGSGRVRSYRDPAAFREDREGRQRIRTRRSDLWLVHLRRPSRLSTIRLADTQPFVPEEGDIAFCHNGSFHDGMHRPAFAERLRGGADSEVGFLLFLDLVRGGGDPVTSLRRTHRSLGGTANLGYVDADGRLLVYAGFEHNRVWSFRLPGASIAATGLHSDDASLFDLVFVDAEERAPVQPGDVVSVRERTTITPPGSPSPGPPST